MTRSGINLLSALFFLIISACSSGRVRVEHPILHGEFRLVLVEVNGTSQSWERARPWDRGFLWEDEDARQFMLNACNSEILLHPRSAADGRLASLDLYLQDHDAEIVVETISIVRIDKNEKAELPQELHATNGKDWKDLPSETVGYFGLSAHFDGKDVEDYLYRFEATFSTSSQECRLKIDAKRLGDKLGDPTSLVSPGGYVPWIRYLMGQEPKPN